MSFHGIGVRGDAFVIYQKALSRMAWESFVAASSSFPMARMRMEKWITSPRRSLETFSFSLRVSPSSLSLSQCSLQRLFVRCLKVFAPVALKASDKKESFGIMVILQVVKRNTNERMRIDKKFKRTYNFARMLNAIHSIILDYYDFHLSSFYLWQSMIEHVDDFIEERAHRKSVYN